MRNSPVSLGRQSGWLVLGLALLIFLVTGPLSVLARAVPQIQQRYDQISDSTAGAIATHKFGFEYTDFVNTVGSVSFEFCSNSPIPQEVCTTPSGLDVSSASLVSQSGQVGFLIDEVNTTPNKIVITRSPQVPIASDSVSEYRFDTVTNPDVVGSYYVRIQTFSSTDATGSALEEGGVVFVIVRQFSVSAEVPPFLLFCAAVTITGFDCQTATSFFIDLGEFSRTNPRSASSEMLAATNAPFGFSITLAGTTLTSGNNTIPALASPTASNPGVSQFGVNLRANSVPVIGSNPLGPGVAGIASDYAQANRYKFMSGDVIASSSTTSDFRKFTLSYLINISGAQPAGIYATTISAIALANF